MAAFIQKLFKSRKTAPPRQPEKADVHKSTSVASRENTTEIQRQEQLELLRSQPGQSELAKLAVEGVTAAIRLEAAGQLTEQQPLQQVQKAAKGRDKGVYQITRQALQALRERQANDAARKSRIASLIQQSRDQAATEDTKLYEARLDALQDQWNQVQADATAEQAQAFLEAVHQCKARIKDMNRVRQEQERHQEQARQRAETIGLLKQTLKDLRAGDPDSLPSVSALDALQKTQETRWLEATRDTQVDRQEQKAYEQSMQALKGYLAACRRLAQNRDTLETLSQQVSAGTIDQHQRDTAKEILKALDWPADFPKPADVTAVETLVGQAAGRIASTAKATAVSEAQKTIAEELKATLDTLEKTLEAKQFGESKPLMKEAQQRFQQLDNRHRKSLQARLQLLSGQFRDLSDWQGFATEPKQVTLCEQMEYLADQPMEPEAKAERIKELQAEWRALGGSSDRALWNRFKAASDAAFEPCKAYFEAKSDLKQANLNTRQAICQQLDTFLANVDWTSVDWKGAERIHQTARQEWKSAWPVDFRANRAVQKHFDDLLKQIEAALDQEREQNEARKRDIVQRAEQLIAHEPLAEAMEKAKALQSEWQSVGITRHREDRKLWQAFRKACDRTFERRDAQRSARQQASEQADAAARDTLATWSGLTAASPESTLRDARQALAKVDASALSAAVRDAINASQRAISQALNTQALEARLTHWQDAIQAAATGTPETRAVDEQPPEWAAMAREYSDVPAADLVIRAEILTGQPSPDADQTRRMEIQVQRLTESMGQPDQPDTSRELEKLVAAWCLAEGAHDRTAALADRLIQALQAEATSKGSADGD